MKTREMVGSNGLTLTPPDKFRIKGEFVRKIYPKTQEVLMNAEKPKTGPEADDVDPKSVASEPVSTSKQSNNILPVVGILVAVISLATMLAIFTFGLPRKGDLNRTNEHLNGVIDVLLDMEVTLSNITDSLGMTRFKFNFGPLLKLSVLLKENSYKEELFVFEVPQQSEMESPEIVSKKTDALLNVARAYLSFNQISFSRHALNMVTDFHKRNLVYEFTEEQKATIEELNPFVADVEAENPLTRLDPGSLE